ncbi:TPA: recombinase family protein [Escherichia coli]|uniref:recombinase family protein n=1 Tax=Enterobacteriaceae TaxID=543 RepID=UPI0007C59424|nr:MULTISPECIES: recombinase family protein [Enterobacteriaceae]EJC7753665.1 recombinase family protein [Escherichia coli]ELK7095285.1 recombinase family protein [Escherichia coli]MBN6173011.1 recombinase family protein [Escherichia coli]MCK2396114.1 recombinase family protein [Escherichia coli]MCK2416901.1 recombinase family protein [Escherichia coli]
MANIGYVRVSSVQQNTERQLNGVVLDKVFEEKSSGKNTDRAQFAAMMDYLREGDVLHVHSIDRLCRNTADLLATVEKLAQRGVVVQFHKEGFKTGDNNPVGNMMLTVLAAVAQMERETMLQRQKEGYEAAKAAGRIAGRGKSATIDREAVKADITAGLSIRKAAEKHGISTKTVMTIKSE